MITVTGGEMRVNGVTSATGCLRTSQKISPLPKMPAMMADARLQPQNGQPQAVTAAT